MLQLEVGNVGVLELQFRFDGEILELSDNIVVLLGEISAVFGDTVVTFKTLKDDDFINADVGRTVEFG